jgi:hypothetical protein
MFALLGSIIPLLTSAFGIFAPNSKAVAVVSQWGTILSNLMSPLATGAFVTVDSFKSAITDFDAALADLKNIGTQVPAEVITIGTKIQGIFATFAGLAPATNVTNDLADIAALFTTLHNNGVFTLTPEQNDIVNVVTNIPAYVQRLQSGSAIKLFVSPPIPGVTAGEVWDMLIPSWVQTELPASYQT